MALSSRMAWAGFVAMLALLVLKIQPVMSAEAPQTYCSSQNTGTNLVSQYQWQSQGNCKGNCTSFAFAIVQYDQCWCSNYAPADQQSVSNCDQDCPGFPDDKCGNADEGLFGYYKVSGNQPSGTQGASSSTAQPSSAPPSSSQDPETVIRTVVESAAPVTVTPTQASTVAPATSQTSVVSDESSSSSGGGSSAASSFITSKVSSNIASSVQQSSVSTAVELTTIAPGVVSTKIIYSTNTNAATPQRKGTSVGAIAGGVVGGVLGLAAIIAGVFIFLYRQRKKRDEQENRGFESGVTRNTSTMSKSGLLQTEKSSTYPLPLASGSHRNSRMMGDSESISPVTPSDRRSSRPHLFDQRMNPSAIMTMDNNSRGSFVSMDDARDYGRTLKVANPD